MNKLSSDAVIPPLSFPLVGLGASAGGIQALQAFFDNMPDQSGMAFVVIMHLSPDHESSLAQILQNRTLMPVVQVMETVEVAPNHVYVIPPSKHLLLEEGHIRLIEPQQAAGKRLAIDLFFRTLAATYGVHGIAIVLSGSDGDGAIGIKHVKEQGGLTIAQEPTEAEFDSMPRQAIKTGMVDWVLPVAQMPSRLMEFRGNEARMHIPPEEPQSEADAQAEDTNSGGPAAIRKEASAGDEEALLEVLRFLRAETGHDFTHYKRATILRRVARRMQVNLLEDIPTYFAFLQAHLEEAVALLHDLLISVTNFFRDREAFAALQNHVPQLFADKTASDQVRVWVAGCATGEEAYSIAMLLLEQADRLENPPTIQVFATDLDDNAIQVARAGVYPTTIEADVSPERLRRFFHKEESGYRVKKELRERVLFSVHNLLKDSPFSRLDLVTCRNLLIYLKREAQEGVFDLFHFALRPGGLLFLGSAESVSDGHAFFAPLDRQHRLFVRRTSARGGWQLPALPLTVPSIPHTTTLAPPTPPPALSAGAGVSGAASSPPRPATGERPGSPYGLLHLNVLEQLAAPSLLVNANYDIVHLSETVDRYLRFTGEVSRNLLQVAHPALRLELQTALFRARHQHTNVRTTPLILEIEGTLHSVILEVRPTRTKDVTQECLVVLFEEVAETVEAPVQMPLSPEALSHHLEEEILHLRHQLSATIEQYEASLEELKSANEEQQSVNEEMRSTAEELETSKEELQSTNEELTTVNQELKSNLDELSRANGDLQNLMASTEIGTIFLDRQLLIKRYTPRIRELFNIIPTDIGRPLSDITHKLNYHLFTEDAARVLDTLARSEREVRNGGHTFLVRMLPYRTPDDYIDGVVLSFIDVTERNKAEEALRESEEKFRTLFETVDEGFTINEIVTDENDNIIDAIYRDANAAFEQHTGLKNVVGKKVSEFVPHLEQHWLDAMTRVYKAGHSVRQEGYQADLQRWLTAHYSRVGGPGSRLFAVVFSDITERKQRERQQEYLLKLNDALHPLSDPLEIQQAAMGVVGEYLAVDRVLYAEITPDGETAMINDNYARGNFPKLTGSLPTSAFGAASADLRNGQVIAIADVNAKVTLSAAEKAAFTELNIYATAGVPLHKGGRWVAVLSVHHGVPRRWHDAELALLQETAEHTWAAVERARAEAALRESEARYQALFAASPVPFLVVAPNAPDFTITAVNDAYVAATLTTREALIGRNLLDVFTYNPDHPGRQGSAAVARSISQVLATRQTDVMERLRYDLVTPDGEFEPHWWLAVNAPMLDAQGNVLAIIHQATPVTKQYHAEQALRASEEQYRLTIENLRDYAIFTLDTQGRVTSWSEGARRMYGYDTEEILGHPLEAFFTPEDQAANMPEHDLAAAAATGRQEDERWRVRKDGSRFWGNEISSSIRDESGVLRGFVKISRDLTARKQADEQRIALEYETTILTERNRMAQELHDTLAQGFTGIKLQLEVGQSSLQSAPPDVEEGLQRVVRAKEIAANSHQEARRSIRALRSPLLENASLPEALQRLAKELSDSVEVLFALEGTPFPLSALAENDLYRIGQEAVTNAVRHSEAQRIVMTLTYVDDQVHLGIVDDGRGFDPNSERVGFGVAGMQERARRLGAELHITSRPGQGTQVNLTYHLPVGQSRSVP